MGFLEMKSFGQYKIMLKKIIISIINPTRMWIMCLVASNFLGSMVLDSLQSPSTIEP